LTLRSSSSEAEETINSSNDPEDHVHSPTNKKRKIEIITEPNSNQNISNSSTPEQKTDETEQTQTDSPQQKKRRIDVQ
jgi:hypothetical protein